PGGGPPLHVHSREDEAFFILEGELAVHVDGRDITATSGTWVTLARRSLHTFRNAGTTTARMLIVVTPSGLERYFAEVGQGAAESSVTHGASPAGWACTSRSDMMKTRSHERREAWRRSHTGKGSSWHSSTCTGCCTGGGRPSWTWSSSSA